MKSCPTCKHPAWRHGKRDTRHTAFRNVAAPRDRDGCTVTGCTCKATSVS